jgi:tetratricopeptide (TPR) repeat protein
MCTPGGFTVHTEQNLKVTGSLRLTKGSAPKPEDDKGKKLEKADKAEEKLKPKGVDKQQLSIDLLMVGCVQSFIDFFYITHRKLSSVQNPLGEGSLDVHIPEETLVFFKDTLESAETARRMKNYHHCFEHYNVLSDYFEKMSDLRTAMYFYARCSEVATEVDARESIAKANLNLGLCEEKQSHWEEAMKYHEKALLIANQADSLPLQIRSASRLVHVYRTLAEKCEKANKLEDATVFYERCLHCARLSKDSALEGDACHRLGKAKHNLGNYDKAIELQTAYLDMAKTLDDRAGEAAARAALAHAYEAIGNKKEAINHLECLLNVANDAGELQAQVSACLNLGLLYHDRCEFEKSVELLEQHFDLARQLGDRKLIDSARVILGMARGHGKMGSYVNMINTDLPKLLLWKSKRIPLED